MEDKYIINQRYLISYNLEEVNVYELFPNENKVEHKPVCQFKTKVKINLVEFNPLIDNIILLSFIDGTSKIYNILKDSIEEKIIFEGINESSIYRVIFNYLDPNLIVSSTKYNIIIWDVRKSSFLNIINLNNSNENIKNNAREKIERIINLRWTIFSSRFLEIKTSRKFLLINIDNINKPKEIINYNDKTQNIEKTDRLIALNENKLLIIKTNEIQRKDIDKNKVDYIEIKDITDINEDLIYNDIIIIFSNSCINLIKISSFCKIQVFNHKCTSVEKPYFFFIKNENEISFYLSYKIDVSNGIKRIDLKLDKKINKNEYLDVSNISNGFYEKYEENVGKYISILDSKENIEDPIYPKNYMKIDAINQYFNCVKDINIFDRKNIVNNIMSNINNDTISKIKQELDISNFKNLIGFSDTFIIKDTKKRKNEINDKLKKNFEEINNLYIQIAKLLSIDNTNDKLLELYLLLIKLYGNELIKKYGEEYFEKYEDELNYYSSCFTPENYKILFDKQKDSEKDKLIKSILIWMIKIYLVDNIIKYLNF